MPRGRGEAARHAGDRQLAEVDDRIRDLGAALDPSLEVSPVLKLSLANLEEEARRTREAVAKARPAEARRRLESLHQATVSARNAAALDTGVPPEATRSLDTLLELVGELESDYARSTT